MSTTISELKKLKTTKQIERDVLEYIIWQLSAMANEALAETTAKEIIDGGFTLKDATGEIQKAAKQGAISDVDGYRAVRKYLHIDGVVTDAEAALYFLRDIPKETILDLIGKIKRDDPAVTKPMLDLDIDGLFD